MRRLAGPSLLDLPDEVIQAVVSYIPPLATIALNQTCRRLANITSEPLLWKSFCLTSFKWWDKRHSLPSKLKDPSFIGWQTLFRDRHRSSGIARRALDEIIECEDGRLDRLDQILQVGYDAKEDLISAYRTSAASPNHLAQR